MVKKPTYEALKQQVDQLETRLVERKRSIESEDRYRTMLESMKDQAYIVSSEYCIEYMNPAMIKRIGYDGTGLICYNVFYDRDEKCVLCDMDQIRDGQDQEFEWVNPKDNRNYSVVNTPIFHEKGTVSKMTVLRDITDVKLVEAKLLQSQKLESIVTLAGGFAHDFRNLLSIMLANISLCKMPIDDDEKRIDALDDIEKAANQAKDLVQRFIDFSKGTSAVKKTGSLKTLINSLADLYLRDSPFAHEISISDNLWPVAFDEAQIRTVFVHILNNATEAMPKGGMLKITGKNLYKPENNRELTLPFTNRCYVKISIQDTGHGIPEYQQLKLFDPYYSTKQPGTQKGMGLGLTTAYAIIDQHNGYIDIQSQVETGTTVSIYLPVTEKRDDNHVLPVAQPESPTIQLMGINRQLVEEIEKREQIEKDLRESESKYRGLFENINSGVAVYKDVSDGKDFIFQDFNKAGEIIDQISRKDVIGRSVLDIFPGVKTFGLFDVFQRVWRTGISESFPIALYSDNRISGWRDNFVYKLPSGYIVAVYADKTEQKLSEKALHESEEKYRTIFENSKDAVYMTSRSGDFIDINQAFLDLFGNTKADMENLNVRNIYANPKERLVFQKHIEKKGYVRDYEIRFQKKTGVKMECLVTATVRRDKKGNVLGYQGIIRDVTEQKLSEEDLKRLNKALLKEHNQRMMLSRRLIDLLEKDRRQMAMELHDDIGQSLTSLKLGLETIEKKISLQDQQLTAQIVNAENITIQTLKKIKNISHSLRPAVLDTLGLIASIRELINQIRQQIDLEIHFFHQGVPENIEAEKELTIYRITQEAFSNVLKHARAKNAYVSLIQINHRLSLGIEDDGVGFDQQATLSSTESRGPLGLLIMRERAIQCNGEFTVESREGEGTHILVQIPI